MKGGLALLRAGGLAVAGLACLTAAPVFAQRAIVLVRHAEKAVSAERPNDPPLTSDGEERAQRLAKLLADFDVTAIFVTKYERTRATAAPLAVARGLTPKGKDELIAPKDLVKRLRKDHAKDVVLVVGHSNTLPEILRELGFAGPIAIGESDYDNVFIVIPKPKGGSPAFLRTRY